MPFDFSPAGWVGASVGGVIGLFLAALLLRSACDLCGVDPAPRYLRCLVVALVVGLIHAAIGYGLGRGMLAFASLLHLSDTAAAVLAVLADVPVSAAVSTVAFMIGLRLRFTKALLVWLIYTLLSLLIGAVIFMLALGGMTTIDAFGRLF